MTDTLRKHMIRYPAARPSTIQYLAKRDQTTDQLKREILANEKQREAEIKSFFKPWWKRLLSGVRKGGSDADG